MPNTPRLNWILFGFYVFASIVVLVAALVVPSVRAMAYAPLRDVIVPPPAPIVVSLLYSTEKAAWIDEVITQFDAARRDVNWLSGHPIHIEKKKMGSREMYLAVLDGAERPDMISPASSLQVSLLQDLSASKFGAPVVNMADQNKCQPVLTSPLVIVAWKERADVLWGDDPNGSMWLRLHKALTSETWDAYGHAEWGYIKFGHTDPLKSNSGFQTILLMAYNYFGKTTGLTNDDLNDPEFQAWFVEFEGTISKFGDSTGTYMEEIVAYGPSQYDIVAVYEATAIEHMENAKKRYGDQYGGLRIYYPPATSLSDHPFCVLQAEWVTPNKAKAAQKFLDFLSSREMQELGLKYGFRPVDPSIQLEKAGSPLVQYQANGVKIAIPPTVETPPGNVLNMLLEFWRRNVQP
jgi:ABC-type Fe3+ transport system substrate-binding protein